MARDFDGSNDDIDLTLAASQVGLTTRSVAGWFYFDSVAQYRRIMQNGNAWPNLDWDWEFDDGFGLVFADHGWSTGTGSWSISKPSTGSWVHLCYTYDAGSTGNNPVIYKDGASQSITERETPSGTYSYSQTNFYLGSDSGSGQYHDGRMAEIAIWDRVLTSGEVAILGDAYSPLFIPNGLVLYLPLMGRTSPEIELIGGSNGTLTETSAISHPRIIYPSLAQIRRFGAGAAPAVTANAWRLLTGVGL